MCPKKIIVFFPQQCFKSLDKYCEKQQGHVFIKEDNRPGTKTVYPPTYLLFCNSASWVTVKDNRCVIFHSISVVTPLMFIYFRLMLKKVPETLLDHHQRGAKTNFVWNITENHWLFPAWLVYLTLLETLDNKTAFNGFKGLYSHWGLIYIGVQICAFACQIRDLTGNILLCSYVLYRTLSTPMLFFSTRDCYACNVKWRNTTFPAVARQTSVALIH